MNDWAVAKDTHEHEDKQMVTTVYWNHVDMKPFQAYGFYWKYIDMNPCQGLDENRKREILNSISVR